MVSRNSKGQILLEAVFLIAMVLSLLIVFQGLIEKHHIDTKKIKLSQEKFRNLQRDTTNEKL